MTEETVPKATVEAIAASIRELLALKDREKGTMAELIRWCTRELRADPSTHRLTGHETYIEHARIVRENRHNRELAILYLECLATRLEEQSKAGQTV